jgi:serine/threonine protein phosphatase PrpC
MGITLVAMVLEGDSYQIANVGDSRAYLLSGDGIRQVTEDHSYVNEAIKQGQSESEAVASQWRNILTRAIGTDANVVVDLFGPFSVENDTAVLLCSDGLYKALTDSDLRDLFVQSMGPSGAAQALVDAAYEGGSDDNISVAIAEFGEVP